MVDTIEHATNQGDTEFLFVSFGKSNIKEGEAVVSPGLPRHKYARSQLLQLEAKNILSDNAVFVIKFIHFQFLLVFFDMTTMEEGEAVILRLPRHKYAWGAA